MAYTFYVFTKKYLRLIIAIFILGVFLGSLTLNLVVSRRIDNLILEKSELESKLNEKQNQIENLEENLQQYREEIITNLVIKLETDLNEHKQQQIKEKIYNLLENQMGKEVSEVDPLTIRDIIHDRIISIENKDFTLNLFYIVLKQELELYIRIDDQVLQYD